MIAIDTELCRAGPVCNFPLDFFCSGILREQSEGKLRTLTGSKSGQALFSIQQDGDFFRIADNVHCAAALNSTGRRGVHHYRTRGQRSQQTVIVNGCCTRTIFQRPADASFRRVGRGKYRNHLYRLAQLRVAGVVIESRYSETCQCASRRQNRHNNFIKNSRVLGTLHPHRDRSGRQGCQYPIL